MSQDETSDQGWSAGSASAPATSSEGAVRERYGAAARATEPQLCCPIEYDSRYLEVIPQEVLERDYGCGDPSRFAADGDTVLDLGSGGGKICFIAAQVVGPKGRVIGVDMTDEMLELARSAAPKVAEQLGYANVEFRRGKIQDLSLDHDRLSSWLAENPVTDAAGLLALEDESDRLRRELPLIPDESIDLVVSNCVLNLVREADKGQLIREIFRVLRRGGRIAISDIVSDEEIPEHLKQDSELWSGCISGAFEEREFLARLADAGFYAIEIAEWAEQPFAVVEGIEFRSLTVTAKKGKEGACYEANQAVVYRGPWKRVEDDDGHVLERGERVAVCAKTHEILTSAPYGEQLVSIAPREAIPESERELFDCSRTQRRDPRESKGQTYRETRAGDACCGPEECC